MSTKIYDAYKVNGDFKTVQLVRSKLRQLNMEHLEREVIRAGWEEPVSKFVSCKDFDHLFLGMLVRNEYALLDVKTFVSRSNKFELIRQFLGSTATLFELNGTFYIMMHGYLDVKPLVDEDLLIDYHYQNQTDPYYVDLDLPEGMMKALEQEYEERAKVWDEIFGKDNLLGIPALSGYGMNI